MQVFSIVCLILCSNAALGRVLVCHDISSREELLRLASLFSEKRESNETFTVKPSMVHIPEYEYALDPSNASVVESSAMKNASVKTGNWIFGSSAPQSVTPAFGVLNETAGVEYADGNTTDSGIGNETPGVEYFDGNATFTVVNGSDSLIADNTTAFALNDGENHETTTAGATTRLFWNLLNPALGSNPLLPPNGLLPALPAPAPLPLPALRPALMAPPPISYPSFNYSRPAPVSGFQVVGGPQGAGIKKAGNDPYEPPLVEDDSSEEASKDRRNIVYPLSGHNVRGTHSYGLSSGYKFPLASPYKKQKVLKEYPPAAAPPMKKKKMLGNRARYQYFQSANRSKYHRPSH